MELANLFRGMNTMDHGEEIGNAISAALHCVFGASKPVSDRSEFEKQLMQMLPTRLLNTDCIESHVWRAAFDGGALSVKNLSYFLKTQIPTIAQNIKHVWLRSLRAGASDLKRNCALCHEQYVSDDELAALKNGATALSERRALADELLQRVHVAKLSVLNWRWKHCKTCNVDFHRDENAARNILGIVAHHCRFGTRPRAFQFKKAVKHA